MLLPDESTLIAALPFPALIAALRAAFAAGAEVPLRHTHHVGAGISLLMPAWDADGFYGVKIVNIFGNNHLRGKPGLHATYVLHDATTGEPLAIFDGNVITSRRTAAASALGVDYLARPDARSLLVCGAGRRFNSIRWFGLLDECCSLIHETKSIRCGRRKKGEYWQYNVA